MITPKIKYRKEIIVNVRIPGSLWHRVKAWMRKEGIKTDSEAVRASLRETTKNVSN